MSQYLRVYKFTQENEESIKNLMSRHSYLQDKEWKERSHTHTHSRIRIADFSGANIAGAANIIKSIGVNCSGAIREANFCSINKSSIIGSSGLAFDTGVI